MATAIAQNGYRKSDQGLYTAFQSAAGLSPADGFPGTHTMTALGATLQQLGMTLGQLTDGYTGQPVATYVWSSSYKGMDCNANPIPCYDGVNAPPWAEWNR
jgi:hypothetical protein